MTSLPRHDLRHHTTGARRLDRRRRLLFACLCIALSLPLVGLAQMPDVQPHEYLLVVDGTPGDIAKFPKALQMLACVGLDCTVPSRGVTVLSAAEYAALAPQANASLRFYKTLTPQLRAAA